jgi:hypothetical protein
MLSSAIANIDELSNLSDTTEVGMHKRKILHNIIIMRFRLLSMYKYA